MLDTEKVLSKSPSPWLINLAYPLNSLVILPFYFKNIEVIGKENIPSNGPVIVAPTHRSRWDALIVPHAVGKCVSGRVLWFMVTADEMKGAQGWIISRLGCFPVDTARPAADSIEKSKYLLLKGEMLTIFPEGDIFRNKEVQPLKKGIARIALDVERENLGIGVKILPVRLTYSQKIPKWRTTSVKINIGSPLVAGEYLGDSLKKSSENLTQILETSLRQL
jgi:1-acyl-sn-glycerol-3-phosphate acyltransferase